MKSASFILLILLSSCVTETYETRLEIENNLDNQLNCIIYPKMGIYISCDTNSIISGHGGFEVVYAIGQSKSPDMIMLAVIDSIRMIFTNPSDSNKIVLLFKQSQVSNYKNNLFAGKGNWTSSTEISQTNSKVKLHLETCIFEINQDSIINTGN
jgi:hypothetical protein